MAKAVGEPTPPTQLSLRDARTRVATALDCPPQDAERFITHWCFKRSLEWGSRAIDGSIRVPKGMTQRQAADAAQRELFSNPDAVQFNFDENWITKTIGINEMGAIRFKVLGVWVSAEALEELLAPRPIAEIDRPKEWFAKARSERYLQRPNEGVSEYAKRLEPLMRAELGEAAWDWDTIRRRFYDK
jgi:hypothetical protein